MRALTSLRSLARAVRDRDRDRHPGWAGTWLAGRLIAVLPADVCGLRETARVVRYLAAGSAGPVTAGLRVDSIACDGSGLCAEMLPN